MSIDLFSPLPALQNAQSNLASDLPAEFTEAFDVSTRSMTEWNSSVNDANARERALATFYDDVKTRTGVQLPLYGMGGNVSLEELNDAITKLPQDPNQPEQSYRPLSENDIHSMALTRMRRAHDDAAAFSRRETTWGGTLGTVTGTLAAGVSDPVAIATLPLGGAGQAGIAFRALEFALIGGGTEAAIAGAGAASREAAVPGSLREIPGEIASAALFGGVFGAGIGGLQKLAETGAKTLPVTVRDEVHAATSEAQLNLTNPFPTAAGEAAARDATIEATRSAVRGEPVRAGDGFALGHTADYAASLSPEYRLATSAVPRNPVNSIVFVDADKLDAMLGPMNRTYSADKRTGAKEFLASGPENWNPPEISARVNKRHGGDIVDIVDGQHRWAAMRDREMPVVPVEMDAASARKAKDLGLVVDRPQPADYALAAKSQTPEELAIAGEKHLRPETYGLEPEVERFDRMPSEADDVASYWDKRLEAATPEERAALGASDGPPPPLATVKVEDREFADTRGTGIKLHGSSKSEVIFDEGHYSTLNYYGQGFYTTDAADVAYGYSKRGSKASGERNLYQVGEKQPVKILDAEEPLTPEIKAILTKADGRDGYISQAIEDAGAKNVREVFDEVRDIATGDAISADEIQEIFSAMHENLIEAGYRGMSHLGGLRTGAKAHNVTIYFRPEEDLFAKKTRFDIFEAQNIKPREPVSAPDLTPKQMVALEADPKTFDVAAHDLDHVLAANPDAEFSTQVRMPDGSYQFTTQKLSDVIKELDEFERAGKELEACVIGLEAAE